MALRHQVEPVSHPQLAVVGRVVDAVRRIVFEGARDARGEIVGVDVAGVDVVLRAQDRRTGPQSLELDLAEFAARFEREFGRPLG